MSLKGSGSVPYNVTLHLNLLLIWIVNTLHRIKGYTQWMEREICTFRAIKTSRRIIDWRKPRCHIQGENCCVSISDNVRSNEKVLTCISLFGITVMFSRYIYIYIYIYIHRHFYIFLYCILLEISNICNLFPLYLVILYALVK